MTLQADNPARPRISPWERKAVEGLWICGPVSLLRVGKVWSLELARLRVYGAGWAILGLSILGGSEK